MLERGVVIENNGDGIDVQMQPSAACGSCSACFMDTSKLQILHLNQELSVSPGDSVEVEVRPAFALQSAFILFFMPLLMFVAGYFLGTEFLRFTGISSLYRGLLGGLFALVLTYVGIFYYDKYLKFSGQSKQVRIVRIIQ